MYDEGKQQVKKAASPLHLAIARCRMPNLQLYNMVTESRRGKRPHCCDPVTNGQLPLNLTFAVWKCAAGLMECVCEAVHVCVYLRETAFLLLLLLLYF